jgi:HK97 family phage major capsid protein
MDMTELKSIIEAQGRAFEEFKTTNDALIKAKAEGKAVGDLEAKLAKLDGDMSNMSELKSQFDALAAKVNRPNLGNESQDTAKEVKAFNQMRKAAAGQGSTVADIGEDQYKAYKGAFWEYQRKGNIDWLSADERKAMSVGTDSDGGYLVPAPTTGRIVSKVYDLSPIRQIANVMSISTDALEGINDLDEAAYGWVGETATRSDTNTPTVGKYRIEAHEMYAQPKATQKLLDDAAVDIESWLAMKVADKFARAEGEAFVTGNGVGRPRGIAAYTTAATADATRAWGQLEHVKTGANGAFHTTQADPLFDLIGAFKQAYLQNARWVTRREVIAAIRKFKTTTTLEYIWQPGLQAGQPDRLLGYPITIAQDMPTLAADSLSMALGDFSEGYQIVDRVGMRTLRDPFTDKPYVKFYTTKRTGGGVVNFEAIKFIKFAA